MSRRRRSRGPRQVPSLESLAEKALAKAVLSVAADQTKSDCTALNLTISARLIKGTMPMPMRAGLLRAVFNVHRESERILCEQFYIRRIDPHSTHLELERDYHLVCGLPDGTQICDCCGQTKFLFYLGVNDQCC